MNKKRVILDTNIIISAIKNNGLCFKIFERFKQNHFLLILNAHLMKEYDKKLNELSKTRLLDASKVGKAIDEIHKKGLFSRIPVPTLLPDIPNDADDKHLVEIAIVATVDYIVTRDKRTSSMLKLLFSSEKPEIISPEEFINILNQ